MLRCGFRRPPDSGLLGSLPGYNHKKMLVATITLKNEEVDKEKIKEEINKLCLENLQKESRPKMIEIRTSLPETRLFKLDNQALKKEYEGMNLRLEKSI